MPATAQTLLIDPREQLVRRRWWIAALLFLAGLINYFDRTIVSVALPAIAADLHLGPERMGVLLSAFFWSYALMQVPIGWLSDRLNLRWLYAACFALWSVTSGLSGFVGSLTALLCLRVLLGVGESVYLPGGMKLVSILFEPRNRGLASGLINCGTRAGLAFGAPLIAAIVVAFSWRSAFFLLGFISLIWLIPWIASFPRGANTALWQTTVSSKERGPISRELLGVCVANIGYGYYFYLLVTWLPTYLVQIRHLDLRTAGTYVAIPYLTFALAEPIGGWIADRFVAAGAGEIMVRKAIVTAAFFSSLLLIPAGLVSGTGSAVALLAGASLVGLSSGNLYALVQRVSREGSVGFSIGLFNLAGNIPGILAPLITGVIIQRTGSYFPAFVVAVAVLLAVLPAYWLMVRTSAVRAA
jgi:ACS family D-galactonate transporter-like MFS transporter